MGKKDKGKKEDKKKGKDDKKNKGKKEEKNDGGAPPVPDRSGSSAGGAAPAPVPVIGDGGDRPQLTASNMMDDGRNADVQFHLSDGKTLHAHSYVLQYRCQKLSDLAMKKKPKGRSRKPVVVDLKEINPESFRVLLRYIYADNIDFPSFQPAQILNIVYASHQLDCERLARLGEEHLRSNLTIDMVFSLLKGAHEMKESRIKGFCMDFAHKNMKDFIKRKEDARSLGVELFQEVVSMSLEEYKEPPPDTTPIPPSSLYDDFAKLYVSTKSADSTDAYVIISGEKIAFHRAVLAAHTKAFSNALHSAKDDDMSETFGVANMAPDAFRAVLKFVYYAETDITPLLACDVAPFAKRFEASDLQRHSESVISHNISANNVLPILKVAYLPENMDRAEMASLRAHCLMFLTQNVAAVNLDPLMELDIRISVDILRAWQKTVM
eukprot:CAMPEP_0119118676 /NCGR_PEP_ID=MMETSP1310-20130426/476_1 /TAXON_ID=464262 /ORGANISM="Genus nov. species nov., Strain RCC2339" /LENGTH=436 /DNA_ID=CAMNT_0007108063 /DNA_START=138 /DNA_END=1448 /DNA_ORIENTATION=+